MDQHILQPRLTAACQPVGARADQACGQDMLHANEQFVGNGAHIFIAGLNLVEIGYQILISTKYAWNIDFFGQKIGV